MKNKKILGIIGGILGFLIAFTVFFLIFLGIDKEAAPKDFSYMEFTITLTDDFVKSEDNEKYNVAYNSDKIVVTILREGFELMAGFEDYTLEEYANIIINNNNVDTTLQKSDDSYCFEYISNPNGTDYHYTYYTFKSAKAFWTIGFMTLEEDKDIYKDEILKFANSIKIDAETNETADEICKNHSFGEWEQTEAPTCAKKGSEKRVCTVCDETETREVARTNDHVFLANKRCEICNRKMDEDFNFKLLSTGTYSFTYTGYSEHITVPSTFDGIKITEIGDRAFNNNKAVKTIQLPDSVTKIGYSAFSGCTYLEKINTPKNLSVIGYSAFQDCHYLTEFTIPEAVTRIEDRTFDGCNRLSSVNIPSKVTYIGSSAFSMCQIESIILPATLKEIGDSAFSTCNKLKTVTFENGIKISKILNNTFSSTAITEITIPEGVTEIGREAFYWASNLKTVNLPSTIKSIGDIAFLETANNLTVNYAGTQVEWKKVNLGIKVSESIKKINYGTSD